VTRISGIDLALARKVLQTEAEAILALVNRLDDRFEDAIRTLLDCRGRVIVTGMGKSGIIARKIAATLSSTGTPAFFLHPAEAIHGDLGVLQSDDVVVALSNSGETEELLRLLETIKRLGARMIAMTGATHTKKLRNSTIIGVSATPSLRSAMLATRNSDTSPMSWLIWNRMYAVIFW